MASCSSAYLNNINLNPAFSLAPIRNATPIVPSSGIYMGIWWDWFNRDTPSNINTRLNRDVPVYHMSMGIGSGGLDIWTMDSVISQVIQTGTGAIFYIAVFPTVALDLISATAIENFAIRLLKLTGTGRKVWVRFAPEMNGN
jgi:hypothetical protein